jgi:FHS family L-fucose permease-like MFS transporter
MRITGSQKKSDILGRHDTVGIDTAQMERRDPVILARRFLIALVIFLFFARGFSTSLIYLLLPQVKTLFGLSYAGAMLTQISFYLGFFFFSLPAAYLLARLGYIRAILLGIAVMVAGCLTFCVAATTGIYFGFLAALFVVAIGIILQQVTTNPLIAILGPSHGAHSRLTLAQAFNSLGTTLAPLVGAWLILGPASISRTDAANVIHVTNFASLQLPFLMVAIALAFVAILFWMHRSDRIGDTQAHDLLAGFSLLKDTRFLLATLSIFAYCGAEVSEGSILASYLMQPSVLGASIARASELLSLYWCGAMFGRFLGAAALRTVPSHAALSICAIAAMLLALTSAYSTGILAAVAVIAIGLFNSIMFPTIFASGIARLGNRTAEGSGILCMAIVGGATIPMLTAMIADRHGLASALLVPAACYAWITFYAVFFMQPARHARVA